MIYFSVEALLHTRASAARTSAVIANIHGMAESAIFDIPPITSSLQYDSSTRAIMYAMTVKRLRYAADIQDRALRRFLARAGRFAEAADRLFSLLYYSAASGVTRR